MKTCANCGAELGDEAAFCHACGTSQSPQNEAMPAQSSPPNSFGQQLTISKTAFYVIMIALALMGLAVVGLAARGPTTVTQTQVNYVTQMQFSTASYYTTWTETQTQAYTVTQASFTTLAAGPPPSWFNGQYCGYPFNPYTCNEGPPVTITGYLTWDSSCANLYVGSGQNYVVWNLPNLPSSSFSVTATITLTTATTTAAISQGAYQVYGFVYPNWPQTEPFPPYPFQTTLCVGIPMWAIPPYIQSA